ncbi:MAG: hypothetical protein ABIP06_06110 [Pyrinomonadaceae bacterium]
MVYADLDNLISDYLPEAKKASEIAAVSRLLDNVSTFVDSYCRRPVGYFTPLEADSIKRFQGENTNFLRLPVHVFGSITQITVNEVVIDSSFYYESDKNGWLYFEENNPFYSDYFFEYFERNRFLSRSIYKVTARFGYAETPPDLSEAVRQIVVRWYETQKGTLGQITPNGFVIERDMPISAKLILDNYKRGEFEI